jgi:uncharacterized repeat protein (TIGR03803 family)
MRTHLKNLRLLPALIASLALIPAGRATADTFTDLHNFFPGVFNVTTGLTNSDGLLPWGGLVFSSNFLYGTAQEGGAWGSGTIFRVNADGTGFTNLHSFSAITNGSNWDGSTPIASLLLSGNTLYGTAEQGGTNQNGTVFSINTDGSQFTVLHTFSAFPDDGSNTNSDGAGPVGGLLISGGILYGTAVEGGHTIDRGTIEGEGTVFSLNTDGTGFTTLANMSIGTNDLDGPSTTLVLSGNTLYGTSVGNGEANDAGNTDYGSVFSLNTDGSGLTNVYTFNGTNDGGSPHGGVILSGNTLYGTTLGANSNLYGTVFSLNTNGAGFNILYKFTGQGDGGFPIGGLVSSGNTLYGTTSHFGAGGAVGEGTAFSLTTSGGGFTTLHSFTGLFEGALPYGNLIISGNTLYGTTDGGGDGEGMVFSLTVGSVTTQEGSLEVTITPATAVTAGAQWRVDGGSYQSSGATVSKLSIGVHTIYFKPISGWMTPQNQDVNVSNDATTHAGGIYTLVPKGNPTLTITSPKSGLSVSNALLTVTGTTKDSVPVVVVYCQLNGGAWNVATPSNSWSNWTDGVTLTPGTNTIKAYAVDTNGIISPTNSVSVKYIESATLTVQIVGDGAVTPNDNGKLLALGANYTLKTVPAANNLFSNWVGGTSLPYTVLSANPSYTFTMQSNLVLQANFVTNVFLLAQGTYNGLFAPANAPRQQTNSGAVTFTITSAGVLSGKLILGTDTTTLSGQFNPAGALTIITPRKGLTTLTTTLQLDFATQSVQGTVGDGSFLASLSGDRQVFSSTHKATGFEGQYTFVIPGTNDPTVGPFGTSYGTVTVAPAGTITFSGSLADGTAFGPLTSVISQDGYWPFYVPLYNGAGSLWGWNLFTNQTIMSAPSLSWINGTNSTKTAVYRTGFTNQQAAVIGSLYIPTENPLVGDLNLQVVLDESSWPSPITNQVNLAANNTFTIPKSAGNTNGLTLKIVSLATGFITGSFQNPTNPKQTIAINGVLLENLTNAQGYFLGTNQSGTFILIAP